MHSPEGAAEFSRPVGAGDLSLHIQSVALGYFLARLWRSSVLAPKLLLRNAICFRSAKGAIFNSPGQRPGLPPKMHSPEEAAEFSRPVGAGGFIIATQSVALGYILTRLWRSSVLVPKLLLRNAICFRSAKGAGFNSPGQRPGLPAKMQSPERATHFVVPVLLKAHEMI
jgi:hypothetical protein